MARLRAERTLIRRTLGVAAAIAVAVGSASLPGGRASVNQSLSSVLGRSQGIRVGGGAGQTGVGAQGYIVVYESSLRDVKEKTDRLQAQIGFRASHRYSRALKGFSARLSDRQVEKIKADPTVRFVSPDREVKALDAVPLNSGDSAPSGVRRIDAATATTSRQSSSVNVAVIDSGINLAHSDLNAVNGTNCVSPGAQALDDHGHGTHVAGTIAAENNGAGVVGVAPGTKVYSVKVLDSTGSGTWSGVICGIDWATSTRTDLDPSNDIAVANMSLGGYGDPIQGCSTTTDALHFAICRSTAAGVTYVVAAGNEGYDYDYAAAPDTPASYPEVLTVTAVADSDGLPGGNGGLPTCRTGEVDDRYASFSNYATGSVAAAHTIAAPGICIRSTASNGGYTTMSGTSMATPHVAGAVALCLAEEGIPGPCAGMTPAQIIDKMRSIAQSQTLSSPTYGFTGDPSRAVSGRYYGYLLWTAPAPVPVPDEVADVTSPSTTSISPADGASGVATSSKVSVAFDEPMDEPATESAFSLVNEADSSRVAGSFSWNGNTLTFTPSSTLDSGADFVATVTTDATDAAGNHLVAERTWTFKTIATMTGTPSGTTVQTGSFRAGSFANLGQDDNLFYQVTSTSSRTRTASWYGTITGVPNSLRSLTVAYRGKNTTVCSQVVYLYNWTNGTWVQLDSRSVGTTEALVQRSVGGTLSNYVSASTGDGEIRVRVRCTHSSRAFYMSGDLMTVTFTAP